MIPNSSPFSCPLLTSNQKEPVPKALISYSVKWDRWTGFSLRFLSILSFHLECQSYQIFKVRLQRHHEAFPKTELISSCKAQTGVANWHPFDWLALYFQKIRKYCKIIWISSCSKKIRRSGNPGPIFLEESNGVEMGHCCPLQVGQAFTDSSPLMLPW